MVERALVFEGFNRVLNTSYQFFQSSPVTYRLSPGLWFVLAGAQAGAQTRRRAHRQHPELSIYNTFINVLSYIRYQIIFIRLGGSSVVVVFLEGER